MRRVLLWGFCLICVLWSIAEVSALEPDSLQSPYDPALFYRVAREPELLAALRLLPGTAGEPSLQWMIQTPARAVFRNMAELGDNVKTFDALSWIGPKGEHMIFINIYHRTAPPEALAALLAHEAMHRDGSNSLAEETAAWTMEANVWQQLRPNLPAPPFSTPKKVKKNQPQSLVWRLDQLKDALEKNQMDALVRSNAGYRGLPEASPGFQKSL